jgi:hypothetical protein
MAQVADFHQRPARSMGRLVDGHLVTRSPSTVIIVTVPTGPLLWIMSSHLNPTNVRSMYRTTATRNNCLVGGPLDEFQGWTVGWNHGEPNPPTCDGAGGHSAVKRDTTPPGSPVRVSIHGCLAVRRHHPRKGRHHHMIHYPDRLHGTFPGYTQSMPACEVIVIAKFAGHVLSIRNVATG